MLKENKKNRRRKKDKALKVSLAVASCYGCGAPLQTLELDAPGYVEPETYKLVRTCILFLKFLKLCVISEYSCVGEKPICNVFFSFHFLDLVKGVKICFCGFSGLLYC